MYFLATRFPKEEQDKLITFATKANDKLKELNEIIDSIEQPFDLFYFFFLSFSG